MKKSAFILILVAFAVLLCACSDKKENIPDDTSDNVQETTTAEETAETETQNITENTAFEAITDEIVTTEKTDVLPLNGDSMEFAFLSGAGAWRTMLTLNADGTFTGEYHDSEMGIYADDYPNGSAYVCSFSGKFSDFEKINDYSYSMKLESVITERPEGEEWIADGIRYISSIPYGINDSTEFMLYLPETPVDSVSEDFLAWWPFRYTQQSEPRDTLSCYGIRNIAQDYGFFSEI